MTSEIDPERGPWRLAGTWVCGAGAPRLALRSRLHRLRVPRIVIEVLGGLPEPRGSGHKSLQHFPRTFQNGSTEAQDGSMEANPPTLEKGYMACV